MGTIIIHTDDLTGDHGEGVDVQECEYSVFGASFMIDLGRENRLRLVKTLRSILLASRCTSTETLPPEILEVLGREIKLAPQPKRSVGEAHRKHTRDELNAIDAWLVNNNFERGIGRKTNMHWQCFRENNAPKLREWLKTNGTAKPEAARPVDAAVA